MGQHKSNQTAILAREGKLAPKPRPMSKAEQDLRLMALVKEGMAKTMGPEMASFVLGGAFRGARMP